MHLIHVCKVINNIAKEFKNDEAKIVKVRATKVTSRLSDEGTKSDFGPKF